MPDRHPPDDASRARATGAAAIVSTPSDTLACPALVSAVEQVFADLVAREDRGTATASSAARGDGHALEAASGDVGAGSPVAPDGDTGGAWEPRLGTGPAPGREGVLHAPADPSVRPVPVGEPVREPRLGTRPAPSHGGVAHAPADPSVVPVVDRLFGAVGPHVADVLASLELADLDDYALGEAVRAAERLISWAAAVQADAVSEMHRRAGARQEWVRDDVAALLTMSGRAADLLDERACRLAAVPELRDALASGVIDTRRVDAAVRETNHLTADEARDVLVEVLPRAGDLTAPRLRAAIRKVDVARDPAATERRQVQARAERCVTLDPVPDGMAWVRAFLPAAEAMAVWGAIDALAQHPADRRDGRTLAQRRADSLVDAMRRVLDEGTHPDGSPLATGRGQRAHLSVLARPELLTPGALGTGELVGYGPVPASVVRAVAAEADWRVVGVDPVTGEACTRSSRAYRPSPSLAAAVVGRDRTCTFPGCGRPAMWCDLDHIEPFDRDRPAGEQTTRDNLHALCRRHHRLKTHGGWRVERDPTTGVTTWTAPDGHTFTRHPVPADPDPHAPPRRIPRPTKDAGIPLDRGGDTHGDGRGHGDGRIPPSAPPGSDLSATCSVALVRASPRRSLRR